MGNEKINSPNQGRGESTKGITIPKPASQQDRVERGLTIPVPKPQQSSNPQTNTSPPKPQANK